MTLNIISLGAGVQSTTLALMAARGEIGPMPDCAIFADTQWEPKAVYQHLERLTLVLPFPVYVVTAGNIRNDARDRSNTTRGAFAAIPWFTVSPRGKRGMGRRQCTSEYKLNPIKRKVVELNDGKRPKGGTSMWIGISTDEASRIKPSRVQYIENRWPLIERGMNRRQCKEWLSAHGWDAPRSACIGCPFHNDAEWRGLAPEEFADACEIDAAIRHQPGMRGEQYAHRSLVPLAEVDFRTLEDRGQINMFENECEGMCGL
jgi:hypothetical protein